MKPLMPPTYLLLSIVVMFCLHFLSPILVLIPFPWNFLGVVPLAVGIALNVRCSSLFEKAGTTIKPFEQSSQLLTEGPYRVSRHPMYLGMAVVLVGIAIVLGSVAPFLVIPCFMWVITRRFIRAEERALEEKFGPAYVVYKAHTRRWI